MMTPGNWTTTPFGSWQIAGELGIEGDILPGGDFQWVAGYLRTAQLNADWGKTVAMPTPI